MKKLISVLLVLAAVTGTVFLLPMSSKGVPVSIPENNTQRPIETFKQDEAAIKTDSIKFKDLALEKANVVFLNEEVTSGSANRVISEIKKFASGSKKPIYLLLDSPGGSVLDGARIISAMQSSKAPVYTVCLGICASMAAMILEYGKERYAVDRSIVMFHPASLSGMVSGDIDKTVSYLSFLKRYVDKMDHHTAFRSGTTYEEFKAKSTRELWIDAEDALNDKLIDAVVRIDLQSTESIVDFGSNKVRDKIELHWD